MEGLVALVILIIVVVAIIDSYRHAKRKERLQKPRKRQPIDQNIRWSVFIRDEYQCQRCGSRHDLHVDHIVPWSRGGTDHPENLQTLCRKCNLKKGARYIG
jgi:5-methylcytosine-specific restriction endonuclease McrA